MDVDAENPAMLQACPVIPLEVEWMPEVEPESRDPSILEQVAAIGDRLETQLLQGCPAAIPNPDGLPPSLVALQEMRSRRIPIQPDCSAARL